MRPLVALLILHAVTSARYGAIGDTPWSESWWLVNPDLPIVLAVGGLLSLRFGYRRVVAHMCVLLFLWIPLYRIPLVVNKAYFRSDLFFFDDLEFVFGTWMLLAHDAPGPTQIAILTGVFVGVVAAWTGVYLCVRCVLRAATGRRFSLALAAFAQLILLVIWIESSVRPDSPRRVAGPSILAPLAREGLALANPDDFDRRVAGAVALVTEAPKDMTGLRGADVYVLFVESYGRLLFAHPEHRHELESLCRTWDRRLQKAGFESATSYARSPVFGGKSQAAHATLLSGVSVDSYGELRALERSRAITLPRILATAGYATVNLQPMLDRDWAASGGFYGFTKDVFGKHTPYLEQGGHRYPWAPSPDQYGLQFALDKIIRANPKPVFMQFVSVTSHVPFSQIPPYHEDWQRAGDPTSFTPVRTFENLTELSYATAPNKDAAFLAAMTYSLRCAFGCALQTRRPTLIFVLGDHQPARLCEIDGHDPSWDVPIHAISNRPELLRPLRKRGFKGGLLPPDVESFALHEFLARFLADYGK